MQETLSLEILTRSDTNWHVQSQEKARSLKFCIEDAEGWYYLYGFSHRQKLGLLMTRLI